MTRKTDKAASKSTRVRRTAAQMLDASRTKTALLEAQVLRQEHAEDGIVSRLSNSIGQLSVLEQHVNVDGLTSAVYDLRGMLEARLRELVHGAAQWHKPATD